MVTLEDDRLVFRFPQIEPDARFSIHFQRTLRIPDSDETYPLPPGLGAFPLRHAEDHPDTLPAQTLARGGVILPMWQAEAMWLFFASDGPEPELEFPVAIKLAAGKINAVSGEPWRTGLHRAPQDYLVAPEQPWLDGFAVAPGVIRQFVAMPLGENCTAEEQLTGKAEWGGLQILVIPLKAKVWQATRRAWQEDCPLDSLGLRASASLRVTCNGQPLMGLAAGGKMRQALYRDPFRRSDWDLASAERVFVSLVHAKDWKTITGKAAPHHPPTAKDYAEAGLPWFDYDRQDRESLAGSKVLAGLKSLATLFQEKTGAPLPGSQDVAIPAPTPLGPVGKGARPVRTSSLWDP